MVAESGFLGLYTHNDQILQMVSSGIYAVESYKPSYDYLSRLHWWDGNSWSKIADANSEIGGWIEHNNKLLFYGSFNTIGGISASGLGYYDGQNWTSFPNDEANFNDVNDIELYGEDLYISHSQGIKKYNNGVFDIISSGTGIGSIEKDSYGRLFAIGSFSSIDGVAATGIAYYENGSWNGITRYLTSTEISQNIGLSCGNLTIVGDNVIYSRKSYNNQTFDGLYGKYSYIFKIPISSGSVGDENPSNRISRCSTLPYTYESSDVFSSIYPSGNYLIVGSNTEKISGTNFLSAGNSIYPERAGRIAIVSIDGEEDASPIGSGIYSAGSFYPTVFAKNDNIYIGGAISSFYNSDQSTVNVNNIGVYSNNEYFAMGDGFETTLNSEHVSKIGEGYTFIETSWNQKNNNTGAFSYGVANSSQYKYGANFTGTISAAEFYRIYDGQYAKISGEKIYGRSYFANGEYNIDFYADSGRLYKTLEYSSASPNGTDILASGTMYGDDLYCKFSYEF